MSEEKKYVYFDKSLEVLAPILIILALSTIAILLFVL